MIAYATLDQITQYWDSSITVPANTAAPSIEQNRMMAIARRVAVDIDAYTRRTFAPVVATRYYDAAANEDIGWRQRRLVLDYPIVSLSSVTLGDGTMPVPGTDVRLHPRHKTPALSLQLYNNYFWSAYTGDWVEAISVDGIWCWRDDYANAWMDSGDAIQDAGGINTSATAITVSDSDGTGGDGLSPRFSPGQLIAITTSGDTEYMAVVSVDHTANTLTVRRGIRGSTAAAHDNGDAISVFLPQPDIVEAAALISAFRYARIGQWTTVRFDGVAVESVSSDMPPRAKRIVDLYRHRRAYSV